MQKIFFLFLGLLFFVGCNNATKSSEVSLTNERSVIAVDSTAKNTRHTHPVDSIQEPNDDDYFKLENYLVTTAPDSDITVVKTKCALAIYPTDEQVEQMRKRLSEEDYSIVVDDNSFYRSQFLDAVEKRKIETKSIDTRYVKFISKNKTLLFDRCAKISNGWVTILFRPDSLPRIVGPVEPDVALDGYFGK